MDEDDRASKRLITLDELADALLWCLGPDELAEHLHVDIRTVRGGIRCGCFSRHERRRPDVNPTVP